MDRWLRLRRDIYLMQLLRRDGCGDASAELCPGCKDPTARPLYHCEQCVGGLIYCQDCCLARHQENPFHCVYVRYSYTLRENER